jgi:membrane protease YdiL (CAAX protease family)
LSKSLKNILAIVISILPVNIVMIWYRLTQTENFSTTDMTVYPLLIGGGIIILILALNKFLLKDSFTNTFNSGEGRWYYDILIGLLLAGISFALFFAERASLYQWLPNRNQANDELINTMRDLANSPLLMLVWFGPVLWIGIALFEEISRTFFLKCLWNTSENTNWHLTVILIVSVIIGFTHLYQGTAGIISISIKSIIYCYYFYRYRRLLPLVVAHGLYDGLQFAFFILQFQN